MYVCVVRDFRTEEDILQEMDKKLFSLNISYSY